MSLTHFSGQSVVHKNLYLLTCRLLLFFDKYFCVCFLTRLYYLSDIILIVSFFVCEVPNCCCDPLFSRSNQFHQDDEQKYISVVWSMGKIKSVADDKLITSALSFTFSNVSHALETRKLT